MWPVLFSIFLQVTVAQISTNTSNKIIGGSPADIFQFSYQISLQHQDGHFCGGTIIHQLFVITAAHCIANENVKNLKIRAGSQFNNKGGVIRKVCSMAYHPLYANDNENFDYDIAIIKLCEPLVFSNTIAPMALPKQNENFKAGTWCVVSGWGLNGKNTYPRRLQKLNFQILNFDTCYNNYKRNIPNSPVTIRMFCAGCKNRDCDSCSGDSGGPLIAKDRLYGVVSWGSACAIKEYPGVYTKVSMVRNWIWNMISI